MFVDRPNVDLPSGSFNLPFCFVISESRRGTRQGKWKKGRGEGREREEWQKAAEKEREGEGSGFGGGTKAAEGG